jgi:uncharacterized protein YjbI with pentapeptide repeats
MSGRRQWGDVYEWQSELLGVATYMAIALGICGLGWLVWAGPKMLTAADTALMLHHDDVLANMENEFRRTLIQIVGIVFALLWLYFAWRRVNVSEQGLITDRYTRGIEQLGATDKDGNPNVEVRLGAIYALERVALDSARDHWTIMEVLTAYVRKNAPAPTEKNPREKYAQGPMTEIQAILTVLGRRRRGNLREGDRRLDLSRTDLRHAKLCHLHLDRATFDYACMKRADLSMSYVMGASFVGCDLSEAWFSGTYAEKADFQDAVLFSTIFRSAWLTGCSFYRANAFFAQFSENRGFTEKQLREASNWQHASYQREPLPGAATSGPKRAA